MKINIILPTQNQDNSQRQNNTIDFTLDNVQQLEDSMCSEIYAGATLDYYANRDEILVMLIKKLRYNGTITVYGLDILSVAQKLASGIIVSRQAIPLLYGNKQSCSTLEDMQDIFKTYGMNIIHSHITNHTYSLTAQRPAQNATN